MISWKQEIDLINTLNLSIINFSIKDFMIRYEIELEHVCRNPRINITNDDSIITSNITLTHLYEYPNYYHEEYRLPIPKRYRQSRKQVYQNNNNMYLLVTKISKNYIFTILIKNINIKIGGNKYAINF